jgi:prepilin-type N-terminal cleavage/methylation domain-containing protein
LKVTGSQLSTFNFRLKARAGVTLVELLIVIAIIGLLMTAALKAYDTSLQAARFRTTMRTLNELTYGIVGNPDLISAGYRTDYGYAGDVGRLPDALSDLVQRPAGIDTTLWHGPYVLSRIVENPQGYLSDGWGDSIIYSRDNLTVSSLRGFSILQPDSWITRSLARSSNDLFRNELAYLVYDSKGNPPDPSLNLCVVLRYPQGVRTASETIFSGNSRFLDHIPIGNHDLYARLIIPGSPSDETVLVAKTVSIAPGSLSRNFVDVHMPAPFY